MADPLERLRLGDRWFLTAAGARGTTAGPGTTSTDPSRRWVSTIASAIFSTSDSEGRSLETPP